MKRPPCFCAPALVAIGIATLCQVSVAAFTGVPVVTLPERGTDVEIYWGAHPYNPKNRDGYNATTNPMPPIVINSPGINGVFGTVVDLPSGGNIYTTITSNAKTDPATGKRGNVTVRLAPGGTYGGFTIHQLENIHIICPTATNSPDTRPIISSEFHITLGVIPGVTFGLGTYYADFDSILDSDPTGTNAAWELWRHPVGNFYFQNIRHEINTLHSHFWHVKDVLFDNCTIKSRYPTTAEKHHRGTIMSNMGSTNISFINCEFKGNSENALYFDGAHCTTLYNCIFRLDPRTDADNNDTNNPICGSNSGPVFLCNDDFTEGRTFAPFNTIEYKEEMNTKYVVIASCNYQGTSAGGGKYVNFSGDRLLFLNNTHTINTLDGSAASVTNGIYWNDGTNKGQRDFDPTMHYNYTGVKILGNQMGAITQNAVLWLEHQGETLANFNDLESFMGGYRIAGNTIASTKPLVLEGVPADKRAYWHGVGVVGGNVQNGVGTLDVNYGLDTPPPAQPTGLTVTPFSSSEADISWVDNSDGETAFYIERSTSGANGTWTRVNSLRVDSTSYSDSGMNADTTYYWRIGAASDYGVTYSATANATTLPLGMPSTPTNLVGKALSSNSTQINWTDNSDNETGFRVERSPTGGNGTWTSIGTTGSNATTFRDATAGLARATTYLYRVIAENTTLSKESHPTNICQITTCASNPSLVSNGSFEVGNLTIPTNPDDWQPQTWLIRDASVARTGNASWSTNATTPSAVYTYSLDWGPLEPNTEYTLSCFVRSTGVAGGSGVRLETSVGGTTTGTGWAVNNSAAWQEIKAVFTTSGNSTQSYLRIYSNITSGKSWIDDITLRKTDASVPAPGIAPADLTGAAINDASVSLAWTENATTETEYRIERSDTGIGAWTQVGTVGENGISFTDNGLSGMSTYYYRVCASNAGGISEILISPIEVPEAT